MFTTLIVIHVLVSITLVLVVLLQGGRGAELGAAFGGVGQSTFGRTPTSFLQKFTTGLAVVFMLTSLTLAFFSAEQPRSSIVNSVVPATLPATTPATTPEQGEAPLSATKEAAPSQ